jgi:DNA-binding HxlR family transcriptional regulator
MYDYRDYCPIAKAAQLLCERWTLLVVRELLDGATRFNELRRFLPRISPSLLNDRLRLLERHGVVVRRRIPEQRGFEYQLTPAGRDLEPIVMALGVWGARWSDAQLTEDELNAELLARDVSKRLVLDALPSGRVVVCLKFTDVQGADTWYIRAENGATEVCDEPRWLDVDVYVTSDVRTLTAVWLGREPMGPALRDGRIKVAGTPAYVRSVDAWLGRSPFAAAIAQT